MAVLSVNEQVDERSGSFDQQWNRTYRRGFIVVVDNVAEPELNILLHPFIPLPNASHPFDVVARAEKPEVTVPDPDAPYLRKVVVTYTTKGNDPDRQNQDQSQSPLFEPPIAEWGHIIGTRLLTVTADTSTPRLIINGDDQDGGASFANITETPKTGWPIQNTAGEAPDPAPETEEWRLTLVVTRNQATYDPITADSYVGTTNDKLWQGKFGPGTAKCVRYSGRRQYQKSTAYYAVVLGFEFAPEWDYVVRDYGRHSLDTSGGTGNFKQVAPVATSGAALPYVNLDGNSGGKLPDGRPPVYLGFRRYPRKDFDSLKVTNL